MGLKSWRLIAIMLAALTCGISLSYLLQMPARMAWDQGLWTTTTVTTGLYRVIGIIEAVFGLAAMIVTAILACLVHGRARAVFILAILGAVFFFLPVAIWSAFIFPVTHELGRWVSGTVPADWNGWRAQWEIAHAVNTGIEIMGLGTLVASVVAETPD